MSVRKEGGEAHVILTNPSNSVNEKLKPAPRRNPSLLSAQGVDSFSLKEKHDHDAPTPRRAFNVGHR